MDNHDNTISGQQQRVLHALREGPQSTLHLRSYYNVMMPAVRVLELRKKGYQIDTLRQTAIDDFGRKHPAIAIYVLRGELGACK